MVYNQITRVVDAHVLFTFVPNHFVDGMVVVCTDVIIIKGMRTYPSFA